MSIQFSQGTESGRSKESSVDAARLNEQQELLLMQYCDREIGLIGRLRVKKLLRHSVSAREFVAANNRVSSILAKVKYTDKVDLWSRIDAAIANEELAERIISSRGVSESIAATQMRKTGGRFSESLRQLGWGTGGVAVTASLLALAIRFGQFPMAPGRSTFGAITQATVDNDTASADKGAKGIYILNDHTQPAMEVDWMRSAGSVRVIPDSRDRNTILWVKRPNRSERSARSGTSGVSANDSVLANGVLPSALPQTSN